MESKKKEKKVKTNKLRENSWRLEKERGFEEESKKKPVVTVCSGKECVCVYV